MGPLQLGLTQALMSSCSTGKAPSSPEVCCVWLVGRGGGCMHSSVKMAGMGHGPPSVGCTARMIHDSCDGGTHFGSMGPWQ